MNAALLAYKIRRFVSDLVPLLTNNRSFTLAVKADGIDTCVWCSWQVVEEARRGPLFKKDVI